MSRLRLMLSEMMYSASSWSNQSESSGDNSAEREKADAYADEILAVVRKARVDGIDIESALRNRLRDVEEKVALIESEINND